MDSGLVLGVLLSASCSYSLAALVATARFRRRPRPAVPAPAACPGVSVLKPTIGAGAEFTDLLRSHAEQDHPDFEILVGAGPSDDAARAAVRQVQGEFPHLRILVIECPEATPGCNSKVEVLERLALHASHEVWVVNDADIRVPKHYLRALCADLAAPETGLVTCLYRAEPGGSLASRLEGLWISAEFAALVLLARWLQGMRFALGATLAFEAATLRRVGGFASLRSYIGEDYHLGERIAANGLRVELSATAVSTRLPLQDSWKQV